MTIPIDKNVELPPTCKYPWKQMEVGDSIFIRGVVSSRFASRFPKWGKWTCRKVREGNIGGVRVWRIA